MKTNRMCAIMSLTEASTPNLFPLTWVRPIAALPFACRYRMIDFSLSSISHAGIESVAIFIGGSGRSIYDHIRSGAVWDLESRIRGGIFTYSQTYMKQVMMENAYAQDDYYMNHKEFLSKSLSKYVVVMGGRSVSNVDYDKLFEYHVKNGGDITVVYKKMDREQIKKHPEEKVLQIGQKQELAGMVSAKDMEEDSPEVPVSMNLYFLSVAKMLEIIERSEEEGLRLDTDRLVAHYLKDYTVTPYEYKGHLAIVDSIDSYYKANMELLDKKKFDELFNEHQSIMTKVKNEAPTYHSEKAKVKNSQFATGSFIEGQVDHSLIFRKVRIAEDAVVRDSIIMQGSKIGKGAHLEYCILDKNVTVEPGAVLKGTRDNLMVIAKNETVSAKEEE